MRGALALLAVASAVGAPAAAPGPPLFIALVAPPPPAPPGSFALLALDARGATVGVVAANLTLGAGQTPLPGGLTCAGVGAEGGGSGGDPWRPPPHCTIATLSDAAPGGALTRVRLALGGEWAVAWSLPLPGLAPLGVVAAPGGGAVVAVGGASAGGAALLTVDPAGGVGGVSPPVDNGGDELHLGGVAGCAGGQDTVVVVAVGGGAPQRWVARAAAARRRLRSGGGSGGSGDLGLGTTRGVGNFSLNAWASPSGAVAWSLAEGAPGGLPLPHALLAACGGGRAPMAALGVVSTGASGGGPPALLAYPRAPPGAPPVTLGAAAELPLGCAPDFAAAWSAPARAALAAFVGREWGCARVGRGARGVGKRSGLG